jgi:hypothetical protein
MSTITLLPPDVLALIFSESGTNAASKTCKLFAAAWKDRVVDNDKLLRAAVKAAKNGGDISSALMHVCSRPRGSHGRDAAVVGMLLRAGANGDQALLGAAENGLTSIVHVLLEYVKYAGDYGCDVLYGAAANGHVEVVKMLIEAGFGADGFGSRALVGVARSGHVEIVKMLIEAKAGEYYSSALVEAARKDHVEIVKMLLEAGAIDHSDIALSVAAKNGHMEIVNMLREAGASVR